jgi:hypothetical protein
MRIKAPMIALLTLLVAGSVTARHTGGVTTKPDAPSRVLVIDGSPVHNVGQLELHVPNWGMFGSLPGAGTPFSDAPSAEWPAGSGVEHLFVGGLWIGALDGGVPKVSTAAYAFEFRPTADPVDIVYRSSEGAPGGNRLPSPDADDDGDGAIDEDPLDGHDNDNDGMIDEDYAAISDQMFSCWYTDDQPVATEVYPEHAPMHLMVRERSYQWDHPDYDDFVGFDYEITNTGSDVLEDVCIGFFLDGDVGNRTRPAYWADDATAFERQPLICTDEGPVSFDYGYIYDADGDGGAATGYFGVVILDHPTDPTGEYAPSRVGATTYRRFNGTGPFDAGGDPTNDFERYEAMSSQSIQRDRTVPADYRILVSTGPFAELQPGETIRLSMALVATPRASNFANVINAAIAYQGEWFDVDGDPETGVDGRETPIPGPVTGIVIDPCRPGYDQPIDWMSQDPIWINTDCEREMACGGEGLDFRTGIDGKEYQVHWWLPGQSPPVEPTAAQVRVTPRTVNLRSKGDPLNARVTLPDGFSAADVDEASLRMNGSMPGSMLDVLDERSFVARFSRMGLMQMAAAGEMEVRVSFMADGQPFLALDRIRVIGGNGPVRAGAAPGELRVTNTPNPFNPTTRIVFELPRDADVSLDVYAANGVLVRRLVEARQPAGRHEALWNGTDARGRAVASGIYFYRLRAGGDVITKKMVLVK